MYAESLFRRDEETAAAYVYKYGCARCTEIRRKIKITIGSVIGMHRLGRGERLTCPFLSYFTNASFGASDDISRTRLAGL